MLLYICTNELLSLDKIDVKKEQEFYIKENHIDTIKELFNLSEHK